MGDPNRRKPFGHLVDENQILKVGVSQIYLPDRLQLARNAALLRHHIFGSIHRLLAQAGRSLLPIYAQG